ncbi:EscU/YscU/HrcU family type III secretion system export apparatus switch protein [Paenalkalicoccus suaedae]|uniref:EscU/YscU/HrcU family type III secretion system export apparatus switch protein n=1 Tax=Paenalkalicoccus suaedae TaxID=2592382 RepID=A0A859FDL5_9BACI|nr:EscU/YscU/HrcU family type III secretion system export apparatus switch protein [Paenalkalicoccus suaedae]QKS71453.1 EscU/YscU/HrcU family type III secretion system export apparatus switch protein [Paenalkalicoccus suaedae]
MSKRPYHQNKAIALHYDSNKDDAPTVKAKGQGYVADEILKRAREHDIPIQEDPSLVQMLSQLEINERIPENLYEVVAEVFSFVYQLDKEKGKPVKKK